MVVNKRSDTEKLWTTKGTVKQMQGQLRDENRAGQNGETDVTDAPRFFAAWMSKPPERDSNRQLTG